MSFVYSNEVLENGKRKERLSDKKVKLSNALCKKIKIIKENCFLIPFRPRVSGFKIIFSEVSSANLWKCLVLQKLSHSERKILLN